MKGVQLLKLFSLFVFSFSFFLNADSAKKVRNIIVEGNQRLETLAIKKSIKTVEGEILNAEKVKKDIKAIAKL